MHEALQRAWLRRGALARLLWPLSCLFALVGAMRRAAYRLGLLRAWRAPVPVIVVGNVIAGGSGKTPVVQALVTHLRERGLRAGVVSRGYGRATRGLREVRPDDDALSTGDEPLLIARTCGVPVFVGERRAEAAQALLRAHPDVQVIVSDDGLQHLALARDLELCVFDDRGVGNGWLLPAGPLREPWPRRVDFVLRTPGASGIEGFEVRRSLAAEALRADGTRRPLASFRDARVSAVAGIASPQAFFAMLRAEGIAPQATIALPDHHDFATTPDLPGELLCTEKDAVKLWRTRPDAWAVPLVARIDPRCFDALDARLAPLSSPDGSQTD